MKISLALCALLFYVKFVTSQNSPIVPTNLQCEHLTEPLGIEECIGGSSCVIRFSWQLTKLSSEKIPRGTSQSSYQIIVYTSNNVTVWNSNSVKSSSTHDILYSGNPLTPGTIYYWTVRIMDNRGQYSPWASMAKFSTGLNVWSAHMIGMKSAPQTEAPWFRKTFQISPTVFPLKPNSVLAYIGSVGYHVGYINGKPVTDSVLNPSISYIKKRVMYRVYDITSLVVPGKNSFGIWVAGGWGMYADFATNVQAPAFIAEIHGPSETSSNSILVISDTTWKCSLSTTSHIGGWKFADFGGDKVDDRKYIPGWNSQNFDDSAWANATQYTYTQTLSADIIEPTILESVVRAKSITIRSGEIFVEMEDVFTGFLEIQNLVGTEGTVVNISISTHTDAVSEFNMQNLYIINASGRGNFRQQFSYHEIQYITIKGVSFLKISDIIGYRVTGNWTRVATITTSSDLLNRIYSAQRNNYRGLVLGGYSVDCPHRERMGYGGDAHTSFEYVMSEYKASGFYSKWARDFSDIQEANGFVPHTAPTIEGGGGPAWSGFIMTLPWQLYLNYGDIKVLEDMYPHMISLLNFYESKKDSSDGLLHPWDPSMWFFLGDWITPHGSESDPKSPENILFNNCYLHYITQITANISQILGKNDTESLQKSASDLITAINKAFYKDGYYIDLLQTHLTMPLATNSVPEQFRQIVAENLEHSITIKDNGHLDTGLTGTYFMTKYLQESHRNDLVFLYASQTTFPGYGWFLEQGYTTWPEDWAIKNVSGASKIHGCYNSIGMWFMKGVLGIQQSPIVGFPSPVKSSQKSTILIRAGFDCQYPAVGSVTSSSGSFNTIFGTVQSSWSFSNSVLQHVVSVPVNAVALLQIPGTNLNKITESGIPVSSAEGVTFLGVETQYKSTIFHFQLVSGDYSFVSVLN